MLELPPKDLIFRTNSDVRNVDERSISAWDLRINNRMVSQIELQAKLLNYFLGSNKSNINQLVQASNQ